MAFALGLGAIGGILVGVIFGYVIGAAERIGKRE